VNPAGTWDVAIIGAGAAGLAAGIFAAEANREARVAVFDGAARVGAKILVAGGGRCNVTHFRVTPEDYNAASRAFVKNVLAAFTVEQTAQWFASMGVALKREATGKLFPTTDKARTVLDALLGRLGDRGATLLADHRVTAVTADGPGALSGVAAGRFTVQTSRGAHAARRVILCTGGRSLPRTGSDGAGYELARSLGHTVTHTHAALVPMVLQQHFFHAQLSGASLEAEITTLAGGKPIDRRRGSLLWTHFGVSGPLAMDASRHWLAARDAGLAPEWRVSFLPGERFEALEAEMVARTADSPRLGIRRLLEERTRLPERLLEALLAWTGTDGSTPLAQLKRDDRRSLVHALVELPLPVEQDRGWNYAEVTAGGVPLAEVSWRTMSSRLRPGLYLAGEILDVDGRIGGLNFQWAWSTGHLAGRAAASGLEEPPQS